MFTLKYITPNFCAQYPFLVVLWWVFLVIKCQAPSFGSLRFLKFRTVHFQVSDIKKKSTSASFPTTLWLSWISSMWLLHNSLVIFSGRFKFFRDLNCGNFFFFFSLKLLLKLKVWTGRRKSRMEPNDRHSKSKSHSKHSFFAERKHCKSKRKSCQVIPETISYGD